MTRLLELAARVRAFLRRIDPNDDPTAEPLSLLALTTLFVTTGISTYFFLRWKIQPMQDVGHHLAMVAVVADYGREGSLYPALYKPFDWLNTNSLLYTVAGLAGKIIPASAAYRLSMATYVAGVPLANLYALRVFGRSAWGAVIAVPLAYNVSFVFGFANFLFAAPFAIVAIPMFYRMLVNPTPRRGIAVVIITLLLFFAHVHVYLWTGVILFLMTLIATVIATRDTILGRPGPQPLVIASAAAITITPSMALFARWMWKSTHAPPKDEYVTYMVGGTDLKSFIQSMKVPSQLIADFPAYVKLVKTEADLIFLLALVALLAMCVALARMHTWKRPPVMELAAAFTFASYFWLPEHWAGQAVIGSRQIGFAMWLAAAFFAPVPGRVSRVGRFLTIGGVVFLTIFHLRYWGNLLTKFETEEAAGLEEVLAAAPPRLRMHYVNIGPESKYFNLNSFWHVEKWYMLDKFGQCNENPAYGVMNSIHYRAGFQPHRVTHHEHDWPGVQEIWDNFDLVLVHHWKSQPRDLALARIHGDLLAKSGEWELWRSKDSTK